MDLHKEAQEMRDKKEVERRETLARADSYWHNYRRERVVMQDIAFLLVKNKCFFRHYVAFLALSSRMRVIKESLDILK